MKEPRLPSFGSRDLDDAARAPVGFVEFAQLLDAVDDGFQNSAIPAAWFAFAAHSVAGMPAAPVGLPGHFGVASHLSDIQVLVARLHGGQRVVHGACTARPCGQYRSQGGGRM